MDGGAWWAAVHGVAKSWTQLSDFTFSFHFPLSCIGEGNGNPLQCSCLENPRDGGAWWAAVYGVAQSWTRLKRFSSSSSSIPLFQPTRNLNRVKNPSTQQPPQLPPFKVPLAIVYESFAFEFVLTELFLVLSLLVLNLVTNNNLGPEPSLISQYILGENKNFPNLN